MSKLSPEEIRELNKRYKNRGEGGAPAQGDAQPQPKSLYDETFSAGRTTYRIEATLFPQYEQPSIRITKMTQKGQVYMTLPIWELLPLFNALKRMVEKLQSIAGVKL